MHYETNLNKDWSKLYKYNIICLIKLEIKLKILPDFAIVGKMCKSTLTRQNWKIMICNLFKRYGEKRTHYNTQIKDKSFQIHI